MKILRNERIPAVDLALLLAVGFLLLDGGIHSGSQQKNITGSQDPRGTLTVEYGEVEQIEENPQTNVDTVELEEKLLRARMQERGVRIEEEL